jgi:hypothetical protein
MYNCCDVSVMSSRLTLFLCMLCGSNSVRLSQPQELAVRPPTQERIMGAVKKIGVKFADKEKARQWRNYRAKPTQMLLFDVEQKVSGLAVRRKCLGPLSEWTWGTTGFKPFKKVFAKAAARHEEVGSTSQEALLRPDVWSAIPESPPRPQLPLMEAALVESSGSECHATTVTLPGSPARRDPYMAVCPAPPTCYAPSMAVCPAPPRCYAPAPRYMPVTPPGSPRSHVPHTAVGPHIPRTPPLTAQDPPTIPKLSERYRESIGSDSEHEREWYAIMPLC